MRISSKPLRPQERVNQITKQEHCYNPGNDVSQIIPPQSRSKALVQAQQTAKNSAQTNT
jgi:hypothetical protein